MPKRAARTALVILFIVSSATASPVGGRAGADDIPALRQAITFFQPGGGIWDSLVGSLAKRQAVRKLDRLSRSLYDLANEKQELAEALSAGNGSFDRQRAKNSIVNFKDIVQQVRHDMNDFSSILPDEQRAEGDRVAQELFNGLSLKWQTLNRAEQLVSSDGGNSERVVGELRAGVAQVRELKSKVDNLIEYVKSH